MGTVDELIASRPGFGQMEPARQTEAIKINNFIYMSKGTSNSYMLLTDAGRIIINTGMGFEALTHKKIFDAVCPGPTTHILLTQGHVDHVGGVGQFREANTQLIAQANNQLCQTDDARIATVRQSQAYIWFKKTMDSAIEIAAQHPEVFIQDTPVADLSFAERHSFTVGGLDIEIIATPGGETIDSCVVWLPQHKILFSGNVFGPLFPHFPNINTIRGDKYRFIDPYLESLAIVRALEADLLITGHFDPIEGQQLIHDSLDRLHNAVDYVHQQTLKGMNAGRDIYSLMKEIQLPAQYSVGQGYGKISWAVRTIWESYMGWFKAQATSELYPTRATHIYPELVELAGIEAVIEKGQAKLADDPEAALLLSEAALASDKRHRAALQLSLDAHLALQQRSGRINFWEDGWLSTRITELQNSLAGG